MPDVVTWGRNAGAYARVSRLADNASNRRALLAQSAQAATPSAVVTMGQDVCLISGDALRTQSKISNDPFDVITTGGVVNVDGISSQVLATNDGFARINASNVVVAVVDTGVDKSHPALRGRLVQGYNSYDGSTNVTDNNGHGTHVAGTIVGSANNSGTEGVAATARIMPIRACDNNGHFSDESISDGIIYAVQHGARVVNLSLEDQAELPRTSLAIDYAQKMGVLVVVAAGNEGRNQVDSPARYDGALAVGSSVGGRRSYFSNGGARLDLTAPGENIVAPVPGGYASKSGTSMAAPFVAGAAALVIARHPDWTPAQVRAQLENTATKYGTAGHSDDLGYGEVNLFEAVYGGPAPTPDPISAPRPVRAPQPNYNAPYQPATQNFGQRLLGWFQSLIGGNTSANTPFQVNLF
jgi:subtilisin family serine protease